MRVDAFWVGAMAASRVVDVCEVARSAGGWQALSRCSRAQMVSHGVPESAARSWWSGGAIHTRGQALRWVDEGYPARPESTYSLVKHPEETMAAQFCRWNPALKMIGLRFSNVMDPADYAEFPSFDADPRARCWNLWGYIDARDGAQAVRRSLEHDGTGCDVFVIANADTVMSRSSASLAAEVFPGAPATTSPRPDSSNVTSCPAYDSEIDAIGATPLAIA